MSSSNSAAPVILRGSAAARVNPARLDADLRTNPYARCAIADARLVDPTLARVVDEAVAAATARAQEEGFARGHIDGLAAARAETRQNWERERAAIHAAEADRAESLRYALTALDTAAEAFAQRQVTLLCDVEDLLLDMAFRLAAALVGHELSIADSPVRDAVRRALAMLPSDVAVSVTLHPSDLAAIAEMDDDLAGGRQLRIDTDPEVEPGSCRADSGFRHVDASLSAALERVRRVLAC